MESPQGLLLVEDDAATRELLSLLLAGDGWQVHSCETGEAALDWLHAAPAAPRVVLCDQRLPGMCGAPLAYAIQAVLRRRFSSHETVLLAMTATAGRTTPEGYARTLLKPFSAASVRAALPTAAPCKPGVTGTAAPPLAAENQASHQLRISALDDGPVPGAPALPLLDESTLTQLRQSMPLKQLQELFSFALADAGDRLERLEDFSERGAHSSFVREAHALKGSFGVIGARALHQLAGEAECLPTPPESFALLSRNKVSALRDGLQQLRLMLVTLFPV